MGQNHLVHPEYRVSKFGGVLEVVFGQSHSRPHVLEVLSGVLGSLAGRPCQTALGSGS